MNPIVPASSIPSLDNISSITNGKGAARSNGEGGFQSWLTALYSKPMKTK